MFRSDPPMIKSLDLDPMISSRTKEREIGHISLPPSGEVTDEKGDDEWLIVVDGSANALIEKIDAVEKHTDQHDDENEQNERRDEHAGTTENQSRRPSVCVGVGGVRGGVGCVLDCSVALARSTPMGESEHGEEENGNRSADDDEDEEDDGDQANVPADLILQSETDEHRVFVGQQIVVHSLDDLPQLTMDDIQPLSDQLIDVRITPVGVGAQLCQRFGQIVE